MSKFQRWHDELWQLRKDIGHDRYPIPEPEDALAFAVTEAAEALDAWLMQKGTWVRNNPDAKHTDEYREWAQCAMMLMLALGEGYRWVSHNLPQMDLGYSSLQLEVAHIFWMYATPPGKKAHRFGERVERLIEAIDIHCVGLDMHIEAEMQRLCEKWLK